MFPSIIATFNKVNATDRLNNPSHSALHNSVSSVLTQVQTVLGVDGINSVLGTVIGDLRSPNSKGGGHVQGAAFGGTGQTTFTKGDIFVATSASVISKLAIGTDGQALVANSSLATGIGWGISPILVTSIVTTGIWNKPSTAQRLYVEAWGGGGSGGHGTGGNEEGGGGGGGYSGGFVDFNLLPASVIVMIGAGGDGVTGSNVNGMQGGITVFHAQTSLITAYGGGGGGAASANAGGGGGGGAVTSGSNAVGNAPGGGGSILGADGGASSTIGVAGYLGGGGGGDGFAGGHAIYGGGGGGGFRSSVMGAGGISSFGGNGGAASVIAVNNSVIAGSIPGGGGGGGHGLGSSGQGGSGMVRITLFG